MAAGTGYSQLNVTGAVNLGGSESQSLAGLHPDRRGAIHDHQEHGPDRRDLCNLPEGASLTIGNTPFTISYVGGNGDDVVLTPARAPLQSAASAPIAGLPPAAPR